MNTTKVVIGLLIFVAALFIAGSIVFSDGKADAVPNPTQDSITNVLDTVPAQLTGVDTLTRAGE